MQPNPEITKSLDFFLIGAWISILRYCPYVLSIFLRIIAHFEVIDFDNACILFLRTQETDGLH